MIIKGKPRANGGQLGRYLLAQGKNERVEALGTQGTLAPDVRGACLELEAIAQGTKCEKPLYHAILSPAPGERLTPQQWERAADILAAQCRMERHARVIVLHTKDGEQHAHVVYGRIDPETMRAASDSNNYRQHDAAARQLEQEFGLQQVHSLFQRPAQEPRPARRPEQWEMQQSARTDTDLAAFREQMRALWQHSDSAKSFLAAAAPYTTLAAGDRRDYVFVDAAGGIHSVSRTLGITAGATREAFAPIDRTTLPKAKILQQRIKQAQQEVRQEVLHEPKVKAVRDHVRHGTTEYAIEKLKELGESQAARPSLRPTREDDAQTREVERHRQQDEEYWRLRAKHQQEQEHERDR